jgi:para-aminobenzoate synthetase component 1
MKFFLIDFEKNHFIVEDIDNKNILFQCDKIKNYTEKEIKKDTFLEKFPMKFEEYKKAFDKVINEIKNGNTYLLNLTFPTPIKTNLSLEEIFHKADAKFKLKYRDNFVCFSPERFIKIENNKIYTYPMKGTIDANIENAQELILNNQKELAEHTMVVDLLRNDLGIVANNIKVNKFRYIDKISAGEKNLLQVSSEIVGDMPKNWTTYWRQILLKLLPAGSISGTPKKKTLEIIKNTENYDRGFYTGIFGVIDEKNGFLDSGVIIRYVENQDGEFVYKSGGGITLDSDVKSEYNELIDKVYIGE